MPTDVVFHLIDYVGFTLEIHWVYIRYGYIGYWVYIGYTLDMATLGIRWVYIGYTLDIATLGVHWIYIGYK